VGAKSPKGDGKWGQADLGGGVWEWNLDWFASSYTNPCNNCANIQNASSRVIRGGSWGYNATGLLASYRGSGVPTHRFVYVGARCARTP